MRSPILLSAVMFVALLPVSVSKAEKQPWIKKDPASWTLQDAELILWDSPWVGYENFRFFNSQGIARDGKLCARIQSARPVRLALAIAFQSQPEPNVVNLKAPDRKGTEEMAEQIHLPGELVISLIAFPPSFHRQLDNQVVEVLHKESSLSIGDLRLSLQGYVAPKDTTFGEAWFRFARPEILPTSEAIQFTTRLRVPGKMKVSIRFDPAKLKFGDELAY